MPLVARNTKSKDPTPGSSFVGQLQMIDGEETLTTMWLLTKPTPPEESWTSMLVDKSIFKRRDTNNL